jgi:hypothetical protein
MLDTSDKGLGVPDLHSKERQSLDREAVGEVAQQMPAEQSEPGEEPPLPLPSVSEEVLSAVEELLDSGSAVTPATLLALRSYLQEQQELLLRQG